MESIALNSLGSYYSSINDYQKALELTQQGLNIAQKLESPPLLISPQFNLGDIYSSLGDYQKSRDHYQQALTTSQKLKNRRGEGIALLTLAGNYFSQGKPQKTVELCQQALTIFQEIKVPKLQASAHRMLSLGYGELGNDANAMKSAQKFLQFSRKVENPVFEKEALNFLGMIHYRFGRNQEAIKSYQEATGIKTPENITGSEWGLYAGLGRVYRKLNQPNIAINHYKQAINGIENIRRGIEGLPPELQNSFLDTVVDFQGTKTANIYRELAELLISQGRQAEARQVLDLLKIQEIRDFAEGTKNESIIALSKQISECEQTNCKEKSQLYDRREALLTQFNKDLDKIESEIRDHIANDRGTFRPDSPTAAEIVKSKPGTVMIYPLVMEDKLWLLLYSGNAAKKFEVKVSRDELGNTVKQFRKLMEEFEKLAIPQIQTLAGLSNIHLVVLSACQTALASQRQDGMEIASLAYAFMNKVAKSVIASLWQVADSSTSELMQNFYKNLAKNKQRITKAEAIRLAQLQLLYNKDVTVDDIKRASIIVKRKQSSSDNQPESKTFAHPYYWAPFVLIGNGL